MTTNTPPEVLEKWKPEFIAWMRDKHSVRVVFEGDSVVVPLVGGVRQGRSVPLVANVAWAAWQEARQTVRIPLPKRALPQDEQHDAGYNYCIDHAIEAIESAGYKCEGVI